MIVGSLLLILVAVTMLIMGLAAGSSALLIGSIAASLFAAVALVVGARQAAVARAESADAGRSLFDQDPGSGSPAFGAGALHDDGSFGEAGSQRRPGQAARPGEQFGDQYPGDGWSPVAVADPHTDGSSGTAETEVLYADHPGPPFVDGGARYGPDGDAETTQAGLTYDDPVPPGFSAWTEHAHGVDGPGAARTAADIDAAGAQRHPHPEVDAGHSAAADPASDDPQIGHPVADIDLGRPTRDLADPAQAGRDDVRARLAGPPPGADQAPVDDLDEDPADEPLPQRVQPTDAVRVSRLTVDVLVVDGRPRYHLAGCSHLDGRESEPVPVAEAVDLGFTPCGLCRPVDALVAEASRR